MTPYASSQLSPSLRIRRHDAARTAGAGAELVLLHLGRGTYYTLNETGARLWERVGDGATLGELRDALVASFAVDAERAWQDVVALVGELVAEELVVVAPGAE